MSITESRGPGGLGDQIRKKLAAGLLPDNPHARYTTAPGDGQFCVCCARIIADFSLQYDVEWPEGASIRLIGMHHACFQCWRDIAAKLSSQTGDEAEI